MAKSVAPAMPSTPLTGRRAVLKGVVASGMCCLTPDIAIAQSDPRSARPQAGDRFVFANGDRKGAVVRPDDVPLGGPPLTVYPQDTSGTTRDGSRLNQVILIRLGASDLAENMRVQAADGIVAYSAVCTHAGCDEWAWLGAQKMLKCPCHDSEFDPKDGARVNVGPAPRRLPALPLKLVDGVLLAAGSFSARVGFQPA